MATDIILASVLHMEVICKPRAPPKKLLTVLMASVKVTADDVNIFVANLTAVIRSVIPALQPPSTPLKQNQPHKTEFNSLVAVEAVNISG